MSVPASASGASSPGASPGAQCRVTVVGSRRRIDLAAPDDVAVVELMRDLVVLLDEPDSGAGLRVWGLGRLGQDPLPAAGSLRDLGVVDGEVLYLRDARRSEAPARVEDVIESVQDQVEASVDLWSPRLRALLALALAVAAATGLGALVVTSAPDDRAAALLCAGLALGLLLAGRLLDRVGHRALPAGGALVASWPLAAAAGAAAPADASTATALVSGAAALGVALALSAATLQLVRPVVTGLVPGALLVLGWASAVALGAPSLGAAGVACLVVVLLVGVLPRVAIGAGGLAGLDEVALKGLSVESGSVHDAARRAHLVLTWSLVSVSASALGALVLLARGGAGWPVAACGVLSCALLLRARGFLRAAQLLPLAVAGAAGAVGTAAGLVDVSVSAGDRVLVGAVVLALVVTVLVVVATVDLRPAPAARTRRVLDLAERLVVVASVPVVAGLLGLYATVIDRVS